MIEAPDVAEPLAVRVKTLLLVVGLGLNEAVTPLGIPDAVRVTAPANPPASSTVIVSVTPAFGETVTDGSAEKSVKLPDVAGLTVNAIVALAVNVPELPVTVTLDVPEAAVLLAVSVRMLLLVAGFVPNDAVTPLGSPEIESVTLPLNEPESAIEMVSVALLPSVSDSDVLVGVSEKLPDVPPPPPPQVTPFTANEVGTEFVALFHEPLKPTPVRLPPAGILPL